MKGEKGIAGVPVGEGLTEELTDDFSEQNPAVKLSSLFFFFLTHEFVCSKPASSRDHHGRRAAAERHGVHHLIPAGKPRPLLSTLLDGAELQSQHASFQIPTVQQIQFS